jgi:hypothetical protein
MGPMLMTRSRLLLRRDDGRHGLSWGENNPFRKPNPADGSATTALRRA